MTSTVTLEEAQCLIGTLPSLAPRPNATNIRNLEVALFDSLEGILAISHLSMATKEWTNRPQPKHTLIKAINNNQRKGIPFMQADLLRKYLALAPAIPKGRMQRHVRALEVREGRRREEEKKCKSRRKMRTNFE